MRYSLIEDINWAVGLGYKSEPVKRVINLVKIGGSMFGKFVKFFKNEKQKVSCGNEDLIKEREVIENRKKVIHGKFFDLINRSGVQFDGKTVPKFEGKFAAQYIQLFNETKDLDRKDTNLKYRESCANGANSDVYVKEFEL